MNIDLSETIAALATPAGYGGIAVIRISGPEAHAAVGKIFVRPGGKSFDSQLPNTIHYGHIVSPQGEIIDEVLVSKMKAPYTYTAEDVAEINCHGGFSAAKSVLALLFDSGVRAAQAGEFTKRAFLNGRIDLSQAEAVSDMITSSTEQFAKIAASQIAGSLSETINAIKSDILSLLSSLEVTIQYPEYDVPEVTENELAASLGKIRARLEALAKSYEKGSILREGIKTAIVGKPNVGKSLLLNKLVGSDKAIVTDIAGTTRDIVDETVNIGGAPVKLMDTAGIRQSGDTVEAIGISRSFEAVKSADLVLFVLDGSCEPDENDMLIRDAVKNTYHAVILNKCDKGILNEYDKLFDGERIIKVSAKTGENVSLVENFISDFVKTDTSQSASGRLIVNARHKGLIDAALSSVTAAQEALKAGMPVDMTEIDIKDTWENLGRITGETADEEIIDEIFKNFCLGK